MNGHRICTAPMMDRSDRHARYLWRLLSRHVRLYTEMITTGALLHGSKERFLAYHPAEHPLALQLGGSDLKALADCAKIAEEWGYDEVNLNVGCPSDRVQAARFGACLMLEPALVAECVAAMQAVVKIPVTVKIRIGVDDCDSYEYLHAWVARIAASGCTTFIVHARKAWLSGLSPKENREIPPLRYDTVYQLKRDFPELTIVLNGGITEPSKLDEHASYVDGMMVGRAVYERPYFLADIDQRFYGAQTPVISRWEVAKRYAVYMMEERARDTPLGPMVRPILGLADGLPGARAFRRHLSEHAALTPRRAEVLEEALAMVAW